MENIIKNIIRDSINAPSGENCQPWSFKINDNAVDIFNLPDRDQSLYNIGQRGSYIAHGALIENIKISASHFGYLAIVRIFPNQRNKNHIATISFKESVLEEHSLYEVISKRVTNRKPYLNNSISADKLSQITNCITGDAVRVMLTQNASDKKVLAKIGSLNESIMMKNKFLHDFFFSHVTWTKEEDNKKKIGFFIDTLELPKPAQKMFKLVKSWKMANFLNMLGLYKMVGKQNANTYEQSSGFGILTTNDTSPEGYMYVGMALEQIWLSITSLELSFQPVSGLLFLHKAIESNEAKDFTDTEKLLIQRGYKSIVKVFSVDSNETIVFMFRFGYSDKPTAKSSKFNIEEVIQ